MSEHARADELIPWLVNGRLEGAERARVEQHLRDCAVCREEYASQLKVRAALTREPAVAFAPQASFNRLWERIESESAPAPAVQARPGGARPARALRRGGARRWLAVAVAVQALVIGTLASWLWNLNTRPDFRTVTTSAPGPAATAAVRAVFDESISLAELRELVASAGLSVAAGPTPAGVYTLTATPADAHTLEAALAGLRRDRRVRFAEITGP